jgi:hypothetical protein
LQHRQAKLFADRLGQQFPQLQLIFVQQLQRLIGQLQPAMLLDAAAGWIHRGQGLLFDAVHLPRADALAAGMDHFQPLVTGPDFAEAAQVAAGFVSLLLGLVEIEKAQINQSGTIVEHNDQRATATKHHIGVFDLAVHQHAHAWCQATDLGQAGAILVTIGQMQQQVMGVVNAELVELLAKLDANAAQLQQLIIAGVGHA